jgi:maltooligosyltrehalose trehalohydrolase
MVCAFDLQSVSTTHELVLSRRFPIGAERLGADGTHFRVWAPRHPEVTLVIEDESRSVLGEWPLVAEPDGYFSGLVPTAGPGTFYQYRLGRESKRFPDPASRFQPFGPHGPSQVVDPRAFVWSDSAWRGAELGNQVLYEMHVGTFTEAGTWLAALEHLPALVELGITTIEMMPVAEFAGLRGWGYDGVDLFAPSHLYGTPDDLRRFVDGAHALGLGVMLDVVYNHFGPDGNFLREFSPAYFTNRYDNEWGDAINFDDDAAAVREFFVANAGYWIDEFHIDGLRFDATQQIFDSSQRHLLAEMSQRARTAAGGRSILLTAENEPQDVRVLRSEACGGFGFDAMWNDDFHHTAVVALTGRREAYYTDYAASPQEFISLAKWGFLYQGQHYSWQKARRGTPTFGFAPSQFITFLENHDQIANSPSGRGERIHERSSPALYRALTALWLLSPGTPMFFQGQEFAASSPFVYFADHAGELGAAVRTGRATFMSQFRSAATRSLVEALPDPHDEATFLQCKLRHAERQQHTAAAALHRDLLRLRRDDPIFSTAHGGRMDGAVLSDRAFLLRWFSSDPRDPRSREHPADDRLLLVNLGADLSLRSAPEPLLAPATGTTWALLWSSEDPVYGGMGTAALEADNDWRIPGQAAVVLVSRRS